MRCQLLLAGFLSSACSVTESPSVDTPLESLPANVSLWREAEPAFDSSVTSLRVKQSTTVRSLPSDRSPPLGVVAQDMRVQWRGAAQYGPGCERWIEIEPRGYVCDRVLEATRKQPFAVELPRMDPGAIVPGMYGTPLRRFRSLSVLLKFRDEVKYRGRTYLRTVLGKFIEKKKVRLKEVSTFSGIVLKAPQAPLLPLAWAQSRVSPTSPIAVWSDPEDGELLGVLDPREPVPILGQSDDGLWARVAEGAWISFDDLHVARMVDPPEGVGPNDRWIDVDLAEQVLIAYEGKRPVFTTLVSTGTAHPTPEGSYRVWIKFAEADMQGSTGDHRYSVSSVPWTMYFYKDFALHAAYWHDGFGQARSNGCVNLSPQDARRMYQWSTPEVPMGWSMAYATAETPGSLVQVRKSTSNFNDPTPQKRAAIRLRKAIAKSR
jgi:hypothetical protein